MTSVKYIKPNDHLIKYVARNMRHADRIECELLSGLTPMEALTKGIDMSHYSSVVVINNKPCAVMGLNIINALTGLGVPWLLATDYAVVNKRVFINEASKGLKQIRKVCPNLVNYVHSENTLSIRWLKWMGFTIEKPEPIGDNKALFHKFFIGERYV